MTRQEVFDTVRPVLPKLHEMGVTELRLFGSAARGESTETSDVDFLVSFDRPNFGLYCDVLDILESVMRCHVDLIMVEALKPRMREGVLREALLVA